MPSLGGRGNKRGSGTPEGNVSAPAGTVYEQTDTGIGKSWVKKWDVYSNTLTGWHAHMLAPRTDQGIFTRYVANGGSDSNDGMSPGTAFATIGQAMTSLGGAAGTIFLGDGTFTETVVITTPGLRIVGQGKDLDSGASRIKAPNATANCVEIRANNVRIENVTTLSASTTWTGIGWKLGSFSPDYAAAFAHLVNCSHKAQSLTTSASNGGTAIKTQNGEGHRIENFFFASCHTGVHIFTESSECVWSNVRGDAAYAKALLIDGLPVGGHLFLHWKTTHSGSGAGSPGAAPVTVEIGPDPAVQSGGQHTFINCDWDEGGYVKAQVLCNRNTFIGGATAPGTQLIVDGDNNIFIGMKANGQPWTINGDRNVFENCYAIDAWVFNGVENVVRNTSGINNATGTWYRQLYNDLSNSTYGAAKSGASKNGYPLLKGQAATSPPADSEIAAGDVIAWLDKTALAPVLRYKGKDTDGQVFNHRLERGRDLDSPKLYERFHRTATVYTGATFNTSTEGPRLSLWLAQGPHYTSLAGFRTANPNILGFLYKEAAFSDASNSALGSHADNPTATYYPDANTNTPTWFLLDSGSARINNSGNSNYKLMDIGLAAYQNAWVANVITQCQRDGWDGVFADDLSLALFNVAATPALYPNATAWQGAVRSFLKNVGRQLSMVGIKLIVNMSSGITYPDVRNELLQYVDGTMEEGWMRPTVDPAQALVTGVGGWFGQMAEAFDSERQRKFFLATTPSTAADTAAILYGLGSQLLVANGFSSFDISGSPNNYTNANWSTYYDTARSLGPPCGPAYREASGVFRRDYGRGIVLVNPTGSTQTATFGASYSGSGLTNATSHNMPTTTGLVLLSN